MKQLISLNIKKKGIIQGNLIIKILFIDSQQMSHYKYVLDFPNTQNCLIIN
jgi:hypothetical protein